MIPDNYAAWHGITGHYNEKCWTQNEKTKREWHCAFGDIENLCNVVSNALSLTSPLPSYVKGDRSSLKNFSQFSPNDYGDGTSTSSNTFRKGLLIRTSYFETRKMCWIRMLMEKEVKRVIYFLIARKMKTKDSKQQLKLLILWSFTSRPTFFRISSLMPPDGTTLILLLSSRFSIVVQVRTGLYKRHTMYY